MRDPCFQEAGGGSIPLTREEFEALLVGQAERLVRLAASPKSSLHHLFPWDDYETASLGDWT